MTRSCDTYILDFANTAEDIQEAFQPFYQETTLSEEINIDLIYQTQRELRDYHLYTDQDIDALIDICFSDSKQDDKQMGRMTSVLQPVASRYNEKTADERYNFRRKLRSFIKWYGFISQICRMFDRDLQKEYIFCSYLLRLLPKDVIPTLNLENALQLEFYKLQETFRGSLGLEQKSGVYEPGGSSGQSMPEPKEPLEEIIERINQMTDGDFTDADKVVLHILHDRLKSDERLGKIARSSDPQVFTESIFPKTFEATAQDCYVEQTEAFTSLFKNKRKFNAIMSMLAEMLYREFNG